MNTIGSGFVIKQPNGVYQYITTNDTINTLPTTLACRTDTYPLTQQIMWEYKPSIGDTWSSVTGIWNATLGISELTITENGSYRCNVTTGGNEQMYTALALDIISTTESTAHTDSGNTKHNFSRSFSYQLHITCVESVIPLKINYSELSLQPSRMQ